MDRHVREIKKEAEKLVANGEIEDFKFDHTKKHHKIFFKVKGAWHSIPFAGTPRSTYCNNFTRQQIRRVIRTLS